MSVEKIAQYISEQVRKDRVMGFRPHEDITEAEENTQEIELTLEEQIDLLNMYIEELEAGFDVEDLQELSTATLDSYVKKKAKKYDKEHGKGASKTYGFATKTKAGLARLKTHGPMPHSLGGSKARVLAGDYEEQKKKREQKSREDTDAAAKKAIAADAKRSHTMRAKKGYEHIHSNEKNTLHTYKHKDGTYMTKDTHTGELKKHTSKPSHI